MRGLTGFKRWKHKLFWICVTVFLFSKSKETGEGEAERREGVGALVRGRVLWLGLAARERGDGKGEGECFSVRELGLASGERREFIVFYLYRQHKTLVREFFFEPVRFGPVQPVPAL